MSCQVKGKSGYKLGVHGYCYTYNENSKSKRKAFELALKSENKQ